MIDTTTISAEHRVHPMKPVAAPPEEQTDVTALVQLLAHGFAGGRLQLVSADGGSVSIPESVFLILERAAHLISAGDAVSIVPVSQELTIQESAELLNISERYVMQLIEEEQLPFIGTLSERRILIEDIVTYKEKRDQQRAKSLDELSKLSQQYGGYEELRQT